MKRHVWPINTVDEWGPVLSTILAHAPKPVVLALQGPLGAGKTTLVQQLAKLLEVDDLTSVTSPTYSLMHRYSGRHGELLHIDLYRLTNPQDPILLELDEAINIATATTVVAVEWADRHPHVLPPQSVWLELQIRDDGPTARRLVWRG